MPAVDACKSRTHAHMHTAYLQTPSGKLCEGSRAVIMPPLTQPQASGARSRRFPPRYLRHCQRRCPRRCLRSSQRWAPGQPWALVPAPPPLWELPWVLVLVLALVQGQVLGRLWALVLAPLPP